MEGGFSGLPTECRYCQYPALRDIAMATTFWLSMGYNLGCMIASDTLFDSKGGFSGSSYLRKIADLEVSKGRCHDNHFLAFCISGAHWRHLANTTEPSMCGGDAALCQTTLTTCFGLAWTILLLCCLLLLCWI